MIRFTFILPLLLVVVGCQTAGRSPQLANSPRQFWHKTAQFFKPDTGTRHAEPETQIASDQSHSDFLPIHHTSTSLYKPGTLFPSPALALQESEKDVLSINTEKASTTDQVVASKPNPLQIQSGDTESFQSLLREIAVVPPGKRNVDDTKLTELLASFREEIMDSEFEADYLALLRKRILPESAPARSAAPTPTMELADVKRSNRKLEMVSDDEDYDDILYEPAPKKRLPNRDAVVAKSPATMPASVSSLVYPTLPQLPNAAPGIVQAGYQAPYAPPAATMSNYGGSYGAGDWQAPTRAAIEQLRYAIEQTPNGRTASNEMRLRMLEMLLGNKGEAVKPMQTADKTINKFMGNQVLGMAALLDDSAPDNRGRYGSAAYRFSEGLSDLQTLCPVTLKNVMFITQCFGFGQFVPHTSQDSTPELYPGEPIHIYMEIENPVVRSAAGGEGYEINMAISYEIRDSKAKTVVSKDMGTPGSRTLSRSRDHFHVMSDTLPKNLSPGEYRLRLTFTDLNDDSMQYAEEMISFRVVPSQEKDSDL
ncbi:MAG: hypothetical protein LBI05_05990 [Planctomycetaceae bacterium]|nr:hypothetical protein [Planctomycetaceae bacterium]